MNRSLSDFIGWVVSGTDGRVGKVDRFCFDDLTWMVRYVGVKTERAMGGRTVLISLASLGKPDWQKRVLPVDLTVEQVRRSPDTDINEPISRQRESELHEYYAWPSYWGGGFYVMPGYEPGALLANGSETTTETQSPNVRKVDHHLCSTVELTGYRVHATDGLIGHIEDAIVDDEAWGISYLVVNTRTWLPDRKVLVSPTWITRVSWDDKEVFVDLSRDRLRKGPKYDPTKPVSPDYERKLHGLVPKPNLTEWVVLKFHAPTGAEVHVAGTFNNWDASAIRLGDNGRGTYTATVLLPLGRYEYKFIVNGAWRNGPDCSEYVPNPFGTTNSVLVVDRAKVHDGHLHTFARLPSSDEHLQWSTPMGG